MVNGTTFLFVVCRVFGFDKGLTDGVEGLEEDVNTMLVENSLKLFR